jgi:hypothetical protein
VKVYPSSKNIAEKIIENSSAGTVEKKWKE